MRRTSVAAVALVMQSGLAGTLLDASELSPASEAALERSVGRVILTSEKHPAGGAMVSDAIEREYEAVQSLPVGQRVRFFWSVLMNVPLDAGYSVDLVELIARDCSEAFQREIDTFLSGKWEGGPPEPRAGIARRTLVSLRTIRERNDRNEAPR